METEGRNGSDPAAAFEQYATEAQRSLASIVADLRAQLERERDLQQRLSAQTEASRERLKRMEKTIRVLDGETATKPAQRQPSGPPKPGGWQLSDRKIAAIWDVIRHRTDTFTANRLGEQTPGVSAESARRACTVLREREYLRAVGKNRGGGVLLTVMPGAADREYPDGA